MRADHAPRPQPNIIQKEVAAEPEPRLAYDTPGTRRLAKARPCGPFVRRADRHALSGMTRNASPIASLALDM